jgi:hypothetical protein
MVVVIEVVKERVEWDEGQLQVVRGVDVRTWRSSKNENPGNRLLPSFVGASRIL